MAMPPEVMVGMRVMAMCSVSQSTPPLVTSGDQLKWLKDGLAIDESGTRIESNKDYTILSIESVGLAHAGNYSCLVANDGDQLGYSSTLRVNGNYSKLLPCTPPLLELFQNRSRTRLEYSPFSLTRD